MTVPLRPFLGRTVSGLLFLAILGGNWDVWWHGAIGRDTFWEPPHMLLYGGIVLSIVLSFLAWLQSRDRLAGALSLALLFAPLAAPFDNLWHVLYGVEPVNSAWIIWSPPHVQLVLALAGGLLIALWLLREDGDPLSRALFSALCFGALLSLAHFLMLPLEPTGPLHLLGFSAAGIMVIPIVLVFLEARRWIPGIAPTLLVAVAFVLLGLASTAERFAPHVPIVPHDHPPNWLLIFSYLAPALFLDATRTWPVPLTGSTAALFHTAILYGVSSPFFRPEFQYPLSEALLAAGTGTIGGLMTAMLLSLPGVRNDVT